MKTETKDEKYTYIPAIKTKDAIKLWWCFPSTYPIGMTSLGYLDLFRILDQDESIYPERIFTDTEKTVHSVKNIELAGFSFSFELDFLGVFKILKKYSIPFKSKDRDNHPLIFGGGPVLSANPEPYADFFDFIIIGDGEEVLPEIIELYKNIKNLARKEKLTRLAQISGVYVPYFEDTQVITRRCVKELTKCIYSPILTGKSLFPDAFLIETARGCPKRCRFCLASYLNMPARYPNLKSIENAIDIGLEYSNKLGLLGALVTEHPDFNQICSYILKKREEKDIELSTSSLRIDTLTPLIVNTLVSCGQRHATIAVEAGNNRLRHFINKKLTDEEILKGAAIARENGLSGLKIYAMIGIPTETMDDIADLAGLMIKLKKENKSFKLTLSISSFVPKAHTPFQWDRRENEKILQEKTDYLRKKLADTGITFKPTSLKWDYIQAVLSRGDRKLAPLLEKVYEYGSTLGSWGRSYKELKQASFEIPDLDWYALRERSYEEILPWEFIDTGLSKQTLQKERDQSYKHLCDNKFD